MHYFRKPIILFFLFFVVIAGCDNKNNTPIEIPDTSDLPDVYKYTIEDALIGRGTARTDLAAIYEQGNGVERNIDKAIAWFNIALNNNSKNIDAYYNVALLYLEKKDLNKSISNFKKAAILGDVEAANQLAEIYDDNQILDDNYKNAFHWTKFSADKGNTLALFNLATMYNAGKGVILDEKKGHDLNLKAAKLGKVDSMYFVGHHFYEGKLIPKDIVKAYKWIKRSIYDSKIGSDMQLLEERNIELKKIEKELTPVQIAAVNKELGITEK